MAEHILPPQQPTSTSPPRGDDASIRLSHLQEEMAFSTASLRSHPDNTSNERHARVSEQDRPHSIPPDPTHSQPPLRVSSNRHTQFKLFKPAFLHWLHLVWLDFATMFLVLVVAELVRRLAPTFHLRYRLFPVRLNQDGIYEGPARLSYPHDRLLISVWELGILLPLVAAAILFLLQIFVRDVWDKTAAFMGVNKALVALALLQVILKRFIGELRPNFISICNPDYTRPGAVLDPQFNGPFRAPPSPHGLKFAKVSVACTGSMASIRTAMESFPSGHTAEAFALGMFLSLYLNAKLKAFSDYHSSFWKMILVVAPVVASLFVAITLMIDHNHHTHDVLLSIPLGVLAAILSYRAHFASVFDYRTNHLYLPWSSSHHSFHPTTATPATHSGSNLRRYRFDNHRNMTAVTWPRKRFTHYSTSADHPRPQETVLPTNEGGLDGAAPSRPASAVVGPGRAAAILGSMRTRRSPWRFHAFRRGNGRASVVGDDGVGGEDRNDDGEVRVGSEMAMVGMRRGRAGRRVRGSARESRVSAGGMV